MISLQNSRRAEMGVGTLIIFIALLLVAAVAAGVLIQTAGSLQQRALATGSQSTGQISTNAQVIEVSAVDGTTSMENFSLIVKLSPGSNAIELDSVTFTVGTMNTTTTYTYSGDDTYTVEPLNANGTFGVEYIQQGTNHQAGVLVRGDVVRLDVQSPRGVASGEDLRFSFIPKTGTPTLTMFTIPDVISTQRVYLYP
jgi:archaellin